MQRPNSPCWNCENRTSNCRRDCNAWKEYEKVYQEFEAKRKATWNADDATWYIADRRRKAKGKALKRQKVRMPIR